MGFYFINKIIGRIFANVSLAKHLIENVIEISDLTFVFSFCFFGFIRAKCHKK